MRIAVIAGVRGRRARVATRDVATGRVGCREGRRQEAVPLRLLGDMVRVIA